MAYCVVRTDLMHGTHGCEDVMSLRFYEGTGDNRAPVEVENGVIAELIAKESHTNGSVTTYEREVWEAQAATDSSDLADCVLIATPEVMYDERKRSLADFINEAGVAARGYRLRDRNMFSLTAEGFVVAPTAVGDKVYIGDGGKLTATQTGSAAAFGTCVAIEDVSASKFYAIQIEL